MLVIFYQGFWGHHSCSVGTSVLPSCGPRFESQAHHLCFSHSQILYYIFHCVEERTKINNKDTGFLKITRDLNQIAVRYLPMFVTYWVCLSICCLFLNHLPQNDRIRQYVVMGQQKYQSLE